ncbi:MAG: hypothetical protein N3E49_04675 [Bacteroidia bacterium]|nr:hypothetical protein [Bacteroidia bacterium]
MYPLTLAGKVQLFLDALALYWRGVLVFSVVVTSIFSYIVLSAPDLYVCEVEFVPPDFSMASPLLEHAALIPGNSADLERTYSYLQSYSLRQELIDTFKLYSHYGLDKIEDPRRRGKKLKSMIEESIHIRITKNATILIQITDPNPEFAYKVAGFFQRKVESFCRSAIGMDKALAETEQQLQELLSEIKNLEQTLSELRVRYKIITSGPSALGMPQVPSPEAFAEYDKVLSLESRLVELQKAYTGLLEERGRRKDFVRVYPSPIFVIQPPYKPIYPINTNPYLLIGLAFLSSFGFAVAVTAYAYHIGLFRRNTKAEVSEVYSVS